MCFRSVLLKARPVTYAPMIMASPMNSKKPASIIERPNARVAIASGLFRSLRSQEIFLATSTPMRVAPSHTPKAFTATIPILPHGTPVSAAAVPVAATVAPMMPFPIASTIRPSTSSITAPAMMVTPSSESIFFRSERMRAVIPTEVAVDIMPMYIGAACMMACPMCIVARFPNVPGKNFGSRYTAHRSPNKKLKITPPRPTSDPTNEYFRNILRFVSSPERKRRMIDARVAIP